MPWLPYGGSSICRSTATVSQANSGRSWFLHAASFLHAVARAIPGRKPLDQIDVHNFPEIEMLALTFCRVRLPVLAIIATVLTWSSCQAVGSFQTTPAFPSAEKNDDPRLPPMILWPDESATAIIGGCGKGRVGDPQTHGCRGPGDIPGDIRSLTR
jgi:hypothetical protein